MLKSCAQIFIMCASLHQFKDKTFSEYFAGIGLMRIGLEQAGWSIEYANDIDADKQAMYDTHFQDADRHFELEDIHNLNVDNIPTTTLATASFPCNDLSLAGMRSGLEGKQSSAFWGFIRVLQEMGSRRPPLVLLENVAGFLTSRKGKDIESALLALNKLGYAVDVLVIDAERFVPQSRVRLFVVASLYQSQQRVLNETPGFYESAVRPKALANFIFTHPEINWNICPVEGLPKRNISLCDIIEELPDDSDFWWSRERSDYLVSQMSEKHLRQLESMKAQSSWSYGTVFRRVRNGQSMAELRTDGVAGCLRTPRGGSGRQILVVAGYGAVKVRLITPRECARLMGAANFQIDTSVNKALFGFGDAVCIPVIKWLAEHYLNPLLSELGKTDIDESYNTKKRSA